MMKKKLAQTRAHEITTLHNEVREHLNVSVQKAIRIGELLTEQKASLKHGQFMSWITDNLPFTDRTARNYIRLFCARDQLKMETVSNLKTAYRLLSAPKEQEANVSGEEISLWDLPADMLFGYIKLVNKDIGDERYFIPIDNLNRERWLTDGSVTMEQALRIELIILFGQFLCRCWNSIRADGLEALPPPILGALSIIHGGDFSFMVKDEAPKLCGGACRIQKEYPGMWWPVNDD